MNILLITSLYYPHLGGVEMAVSHLAHQFCRAGHHVEIITNRMPKNLPNHAWVDGVRVTRIPFRLPGGSVVSWPAFGFRGLQCILAAREVVRRRKWDILNLHYVAEPSLFAWCLSRATGCPLVSSIHGHDIEGFCDGSGVRRRIVKATFKQSHLIVSNSQALLREASKRFGDDIASKAVVLGNGVDMGPVACDRDRAVHPAPFILGVGRLIAKKGFDNLIRAFVQVHKRLPQVQLVIIGDGVERSRLERLAAELGLENAIVFKGSLENREVRRFMRGCLVFALPSRLEPFGIVLLEAMAAGKAVVAMNVGGVPEFVDSSTGILVDDGMPESFGSALLDILGQPDRALRLGANGRVRVSERYTWDLVGARYLDAFSELHSHAGEGGRYE